MLDDIEAVFMPAAQAVLAMISEDVEVAVTDTPYINEVLDRKEADGFHLLYTGKESPGLISDLVVAKASYFGGNSEIKEQLRAMWEEALQYWHDNEEAGNTFCDFCKTVGINLYVEKRLGSCLRDI